MGQAARLTFWRARKGLEKTLILFFAGFTVLVAAVLAFGPSSTPTSATAAPSPIDCLTAAGLSNVSQREQTTWRGFHQVPFFAVFVDEFGDEAAAHAATVEADLVIARQAGVYMVSGPSTETADGGVVQQVASCLNP